MNKPTPTPAANPEQPERTPPKVLTKKKWDILEELLNGTLILPPTPAVIAPSAETASETPEDHPGWLLWCREGECFYVETKEQLPGAVLRALFFFESDEDVTPEMTQEAARTSEHLLANGSMSFEGDPSLNLMRADADEQRDRLERELTQAQADLRAAQQERDDAVKKQPINTNLRLFDLVRFMRSELHQADLITDEEYAEIASGPMATSKKPGSPSRQRLEDYDEIRAKLAVAQQALDAAREDTRLLAKAAETLLTEADFLATRQNQKRKQALRAAISAAIAGEKGAGL